MATTAPSPTPLGVAFEAPDDFVLHWHQHAQPYPAWIFAALAACATVGTFAYGLLLGSPLGIEAGLRTAGLYTLAAAASWLVPLPAIYVLNSITGSNLRPSTTLLTALVVAAWGGFGQLALWPAGALFALTLPPGGWLLALHLVVFGVVGLGMAAVYSRVMVRLEPSRGSARGWWHGLFVLLWVELLYVFGVFQAILGTTGGAA